MEKQKENLNNIIMNNQNEVQDLAEKLIQYENIIKVIFTIKRILNLKMVKFQTLYPGASRN